MPSSWNKGTLVEQDDSAVDVAVASESSSVQEGKSLFQSVVDNAAEKLAQGADALKKGVQDIGQAAFELLPEEEDVIEDIKLGKLD